ncbi:hypothetical protein [Borborobacter arsenicus]|uniref:hypothetical protein n=1 Tax=Borborobacter arsenicus TaxID=1851146 RepID=UPI0014049301|nr:hypothetical protein [Pseudaminobacter arsenicus]
MAAAAMIGWDAAPNSTAALPAFSSTMLICGTGKRVNCVVDGNTIWFRGEKIVLKVSTRPR